MNATDRRSVPRSSPHPCPHCSATRLTDHHLRDAGNLGPDAAFLAGYCPVLAARRTATPYLPAPVEAPAFLCASPVPTFSKGPQHDRRVRT